jgi:dihydropyrimidinase
VNVTAVVGGTVITPHGARRTDVLISRGKVAALGDAGTAGVAAGAAGATGAAGAAAGGRIDAAGCFVLPGGVDPHAHLMADVRHATAGAALGGTTTALSFTNPAAGEGDVACLLRRRRELAGVRPVVDVGLHAMLYHPQEVSPADLAAARRAGAAAVKVFLGYPELGIMCSTRRLFELMSAATRLGLAVQVHCENGHLIEALVADALRSGATGPRAFAQTRPPEVEEEAVARALAVASLTGATCYLVHLSTAQAIEHVRLARKRGQPRVIAEACTHHLLLGEDRYAGADAQRFLVAPPLRSSRHIEALWAAAADGTIDTVGSDHCQVRSPAAAEFSATGENLEFGIAGIGARVPLLLSEGLARGLPIERLSQLTAANPARAFGHYPKKGAIAAGSDADIVIFDPAANSEVTAASFDDGTGDSVYAGFRLRGRIRAVLVRGRLTVSAGELVDPDGRGRYLRPH